jgi:hypothetical protein
MNRRITALLVTAVALFGLSACTGTPLTGSEVESSGAPSSSAPQGPEASASPSPSTSEGPAEDSSASASVADACAVISDAVTDATAGFDDMQASEDPQAAIEAMKASADAIGAAIGGIDNEEVAAAARGMQAGFMGMAEATKAIMDGDVSKAAELQDLSTEIVKSFTAFQELCVPE